MESKWCQQGVYHLRKIRKINKRKKTHFFNVLGGAFVYFMGLSTVYHINSTRSYKTSLVHYTHFPQKLCLD